MRLVPDQRQTVDILFVYYGVVNISFFRRNTAMSKIVEDLINEEKKEIALKMLRDGKLQEEEIAKYIGFTVEQVKELVSR